VTDPLGQKWNSPIAGLTIGAFGNGTGLTGDYYAFADSATNYNGLPALTRLDPIIDFNWGADAPDPSLPTDYWHVRWHGQIQPLYSDLYTFTTITDDGSRLWVNGQLLINRWQNGAATSASGSVQLEAGKKYDLVMEYYENTSTASARLAWSSLHQVSETVPTSQLYATPGLIQPLLAANLTNGTNLVLNWSGTYSLQSAPIVTGPWSAVGTTRIGPYSTPTAAGEMKYYRLVQSIEP